MSTIAKVTNKIFGGLGGSKEPLDLGIDYSEDEFAQTLNRCLGDFIRESKDNAYAMWSALANVDWIKNNPDGSQDIASYSFRGAGDLIAAIRADGPIYMDYYCSGELATVDYFIADALAKEGWIYKV